MQNISAKLLLIDDDDIVRLSLAAYLEDSGFEILQASSGQQGLEIFAKHRPNLVVCDLRMPQMDGLELIRRLCAIDSEAPVIVISGAGVMNDAVEALRLGAVDYLIKPLEDLAVLELSVRRALDRVQLRLENQRYRERLEQANTKLQTSLHLLQEDHNAGRQVQMNMLPKTPWCDGGLHFAHQIIPSLYLSGDFVDYFRLDEHRIAFYLADVSGHGVSSALVTALLKFMTASLLNDSRQGGVIPEKPSEFLSHINQGLLNCKLGKHVTMIGAVIDLQQQRMTYCVGGHLPLPILFSGGRAQYLEGRGLPVGLFEHATYTDLEINLPEQFSLALMSDGVLDLLDGETLKDKEAQLPTLFQQAGGTLDGLRQVLGLANLGEMPDDIALLVLNRNLA